MGSFECQAYELDRDVLESQEELGRAWEESREGRRQAGGH
jgi:hypothetical protein